MFDRRDEEEVRSEREMVKRERKKWNKMQMIQKTTKKINIKRRGRRKAITKNNDDSDDNDCDTDNNPSQT